MTDNLADDILDLFSFMQITAFLGLGTTHAPKWIIKITETTISNKYMHKSIFEKKIPPK